MNSQLVIETQALTKQYGKTAAVDGIDLSVVDGEITAFLGRNGAGKTTTLKMLLGITRPTRGRGVVLGKTIESQSCEIRREVAYVAEDKELYSYMTAEQLIRFTRSFYPDWEKDREERLFKQFDLPKHKGVKVLSKGMRTKLALLLALARRPKLLILDEPSEGLDPVSIEELLQEIVAIAAHGTTVFFSSHQIAEVERIADHVCIIDRGSLVSDFSLDEMRRDYKRITLAFPFAPVPNQFTFPGVKHIRSDGRQVTLLARQNADAIVELARDMQPVSVDVSPVSLREVFLDNVTEER